MSLLKDFTSVLLLPGLLAHAGCRFDNENKGGQEKLPTDYIEHPSAKPVTV